MQKLKRKYYSTDFVGTNFIGENLEGADFSNTDIRGVKFTKAQLRGANFSNARAGISNSWLISLWIIIFLLCLLAGLVAGYAGALLSNLWLGNTANPFFGVLTSITLAVCLVVLGANEATI